MSEEISIRAVRDNEGRLRNWSAYVVRRGKLRLKSDWVEFFADGSAAWYRPYKDEELHGIETRWFEHGGLMYLTHWCRGERDGWQFHYELTGELWLALRFNHDVKTGESLRRTGPSQYVLELPSGVKQSESCDPDDERRFLEAILGVDPTSLREELERKRPHAKAYEA